jgi:hypothetical protein
MPPIPALIHISLAHATQLLPVHSALVDLFESTESERWKKRDGWLISDDITPWLGLHLRTAASTSAIAANIASWATACADDAATAATSAISAKSAADATAAATVAAASVKHMAGRVGNEWVATFGPKAEAAAQSMAGMPLSVIREREEAAAQEAAEEAAAAAAAAAAVAEQHQPSLVGMPLSVAEEKGRLDSIENEEDGEEEVPILSSAVVAEGEGERNGSEIHLPPVPAAEAMAAADAAAAAGSMPVPPAPLGPRKSISTDVDSAASWFQHAKFHGAEASAALEVARKIAADEQTLNDGKAPGPLLDHCSMRIDRLELPLNQLAGKLPATMGDLCGVRVIDLHGNGIEGGLPPSLGRLDMLEQLLLSNNKIRGVVPKEIGTSC